MKTAIALLVLVCTAYATSDIVQTIDRISKDTFGRTLFDTIWLQLEANEPIERLLTTLSDLEERYVAEQKEDDVKNRDYQDACNYDIAALDKDIAETDTYRIQLEAKLESQLYPQKEILTGIQNQKKKELVNLKTEVSNLDKQREEERQEFEVKVNEHAEATAIITEARRIFVDGMQGSSFVQNGKVSPSAFVTKETTVLVQKHLQASMKKVAKFAHRKSYGKIFKVLLTVTTSAPLLADGGAVGSLLDKIEDALNLERFSEEKKIEAYNKARRLLVVSINVTEQTLADITVQLNSVLDQITVTETNLDNTNQRLDIKNEERADRYNQCEEAAHDYQEARAARDHDRTTLSDCVGLVNAQLRTLKEQLALRQAAGEKLGY